MRVARAWGKRAEPIAKKHLEARGRGEGAFIVLAPSLTTSVAEAVLIFLPLLVLLEPAAWA